MAEAPPNFIKLTESILQGNEGFCKSNEVARETLTEIVELMNDAIDNVELKAEILPKFAMLNYLFSVLMPISYAIYYDFMGGNLPSCFIQSRILIEQLAICFLSDLHYQDITFFQDKLKNLEAERLSIAETIKTVEPNAVPLWGKLSNDWVHMKYLERHVRAVLDRNDVLGFNLVIPIDFSETELPEIQELGESISHYRAMLAETVEKWRAEIFRSDQ